MGCLTRCGCSPTCGGEHARRILILQNARDMAQGHRCLASHVTLPWIHRVPHGIPVTTADIGDRGEIVAHAMQENIGCTVDVATRHARHTFEGIPKRWGIEERSFAWLAQCRRLWKLCERTLNTSRHMPVLACVAMCLKRVATGS